MIADRRRGDAGRVEKTLQGFHDLVETEKREKTKTKQAVSKLYKMSGILSNDLKADFDDRSSSTSLLVPKFDKFDAMRFRGLAWNGAACELFRVSLHWRGST